MASATTRLAEDLGRLAAADISEPEFWEAARRIRRRIPFEAWCWFPVDPAALLPAGAHLGDNPAFANPAVVPRLLQIEHDGGQDFNLIPALARGRCPASGLALATDGDLRRSRRWREILYPCGLGDELRIALTSGGHAWGSLVLFRESPGRPFSQAEVTSLGEAAPPLGRAMRLAFLRTMPMRDADEGPGILLLDPAAGTWFANPSAERWLSGLSRRDGSGAAPPPLPPIVHALAARLAALERDGPIPHPTARVRARTTNGVCLSLHASRLSGPSPSQQIAIAIEPAGMSELAPLVLGAYALTRRECELIAQILRGATTNEIARNLGISANTVQDHLKSVFAKTGLRSRRALVARLAGG